LRNSNVLFGGSSLYGGSPLYGSIVTNEQTVLGSFGGKMGLQYEGKLKKSTSVVSAGASISLPSNFKGDITRLAAVSMDTVFHSTLSGIPLEIPAEFAAGISLSQKYYEESVINKWMFGFDYTYQDWSKTQFAPTNGVVFEAAAKSAYKFGFEFTPDFFDARYNYKHWTYRGGVYFEQSYLRLNGQQINAMGVTFGISFPVRWSNMLNFSIDMGQKGGLQDQLVRERYVLLQLSISLYDIWFRKMKYD